MQRLNVAQQAALEALKRTPGAGRTASPGPSASSRETSRETSPRPTSAPFRGGVRRDHPSFTIEALPAVAFEGLVLAARLIGEVTDDDPPYLLQAVLDAPDGCWSQLELVPDAGSTTVSLTVGRTAAGPPLDVDAVRDRWIAALNRLDWSDPNAPQPPS